MSRRQFTLEFKTRLVLDLLREEKPLGELVAEHESGPNQLRNWKKEFLGIATRVFSESKQEKELRLSGSTDCSLTEEKRRFKWK